MVGIDEISFFQVAILKVSVPEEAGIEGGEIEVAITEIATERINAAKIGVDDDRSGKIAINHLAS